MRNVIVRGGGSCFDPAMTYAQEREQTYTARLRNAWRALRYMLTPGTGWRFTPETVAWQRQHVRYLIRIVRGYRRTFAQAA